MAEHDPYWDTHGQNFESRSSESPPTARNYATRIKPLVEGDHILQWVDHWTGERILVAFKGGIVFEKNYWNPNYL